MGGDDKKDNELVGLLGGGAVRLGEVLGVVHSDFRVHLLELK